MPHSGTERQDSHLHKRQPGTRHQQPARQYPVGWRYGGGRPRGELTKKGFCERTSERDRKGTPVHSLCKWRDAVVRDTRVVLGITRTGCKD